MKNSINQQTVLVTGGSGFIAVHCIVQLLKSGYRVRTTVRSLSRENEVRTMVKEGGIDAGDQLFLVAADLSSDNNWLQAATGCDYVLHIASPTPLKDYKHEDELIIPAREGVLRVLRAARDASVKRVVLTSAFGAVGFGHSKSRTTPFNETDWTVIDTDTPAYQKSKTLAEKAAWEFITKEGESLELSVVNPVGVLGPVLGPDYSHSIQITRRMLDGEISGCPKVSSCYVDVRDVADLHIRAMIDPAAKGERFLAVSGHSLTVLDLAKVLKHRLGPLASRVPEKEIPNWVLRIAALANPTARLLIPMLGRFMDASGEKAKRVLGWSPRSNEDAIVDTAESLIRLGLIKK